MNVEETITVGKVLEQLNHQRQQGLLCDCTFVVDGVDFKAHKAVLAACSAYFRTLFLDQKDVVHLDISNAAGILEFMYTAKLCLGPQNVEDVLAVATFLQMQEIVNCEVRSPGHLCGDCVFTCEFLCMHFGL
uniref:BTB domain-containing protein n=1 Tax=Paramormyrops kingsleyae TaxID=1676925 RepID=A0A3B3SGM5_9TELE